MMKNVSPSFTFIVPLSPSSHRLAEQFCQQHRDTQKARQVYLNTLAVSAVNFYLHCMGVETSWETSQSYDFVMQAAMDVADVEIKIEASWSAVQSCQKQHRFRSSRGLPGPDWVCRRAT